MDSAIGRLHNWINGERRAPISGTYLLRHDPVNGQALFEVPDSDYLDVVQCVQAANQALAKWRDQSVAARVQVLERIATEIENSGDELARLDSQALGLPLKHAREEAIPQAAEVFRYYSRLLRDDQVEGSHSGESGALRVINRLPGGLVGLFLPAAEPLLSAARKIAPALAAGCCVIAKPSKLSPTSALRLAELADTVGLPPGVLNILCGQGLNAGEALAQHPGVPVLSLTGRCETGQKLLQVTSEQFKKWQMSLGGCNSVVVFSDVDLEATIAGITRVCVDFHSPLRAARLFVQAPIYERFLEAFSNELDKIVIGDPQNPDTALGPLPSHAVKEQFQAALNLAIEEKGKPLGIPLVSDSLAGALAGGNFVRPRAFYDFTLCSTLQSQEVCGPLVLVNSFKYQHEALKHVNNSPLGQAAFVYTPSLSKASKVATRIEASEIFVNSGPRRDPRLSLGPIKGSGLGSDGGRELLHYFSRRTQIRFGV